PLDIMIKLDKEIEKYSLSKEEWNQITIIQDLLENFEQATNNISATSVSVERAFLAAKELITSQRYNLNPTTIRACMCLKKWQKVK
ncbi:9241_t:CDS:2, partial [Racocetra persica]